MACLSPDDWLVYLGRGSGAPQPYALASLFSVLTLIGVRRPAAAGRPRPAVHAAGAAPPGLAGRIRLGQRSPRPSRARPC
jgi:hypothetical protein